MSSFKIFDIAGSGMNAQNLRMNLVASNLANVDAVSSSTDATYRARQPVFQAVLDQANSRNPAVGVRMAGVVESEFDTVQYPTLFDQWAELRVDIDLDNDIMRVSYDGVEFLAKSWTAGVNNDFTGVLNVACLDLFSNGGTDVYWDDISLVWLTTSVEETSWSEVKSLY